MATILIIDDDKQLCETIARIIRGIGHDTHVAYTFKSGFEIARTTPVDVVLLDVRLPDADGLKQLPTIQATPSAPVVIILTGYAGPDGAELAIRGNAWDYIEKPASLDAITLSLNRALQYREEKDAFRKPSQFKREGIIGNSQPIKACLDLVARAAKSNTNILISGPTGTGKELFARAIHANSERSDKNFVVVDCAALPKDLIEGILFGYKKGAYTGADRSEDGLIKHAHKGTLFLDEVGELPLAMQKTFLRVIQERHFRPIGATEEIYSDFRLVAATNRNLNEMADSGQFRDDLLFRLRDISIQLPPLRERQEDIKELAVQHLMAECESRRIGLKGFSPDFLMTLMAYDWPGNVRELYSALDFALMQALNEQTLFPYHLPTNVRAQVVRSAFEGANASGSGIFNNGLSMEDFSHFPKWKEFRNALIADGERQYLNNLISVTAGDIKKSASISGLSAPRLYELLRKYDISTR